MGQNWVSDIYRSVPQRIRDADAARGLDCFLRILITA